MIEPMSHAELQPATGFIRALRQQLWLLTVSARWAWVLGATAALLLFLDSFLPPSGSLLVFAALIMAVVGAIWPLAVWAGESPGQRAHLWSLPVARPALELARVVAGAVHLLFICAGIVAVAAVAHDGFAALLAPGPQAWGTFFLGPLALYLLVTPVVLWSDYRVTRWIMGGLIGYGLVTLLFAVQGVDEPGEIIGQLFFGERWGLQWAFFAASDVIAVGAPDASFRWGPVALWLGVGAMVTVATATLRPDDLRRLVVRTAASPAPAGSRSVTAE